MTLTLCVVNGAPQNSQDIENLIEEKKRNTPFRLQNAMQDFSAEMFSSLVEDTDSNLFFSPFSIHTALSMVYFGSPSDSQTHRELASLLRMPSDFYTEYATNYLQLLERYENLRIEGSSAIFDVANRMFKQVGFSVKRDYIALMKHFYKSKVEEVDFGTQEAVDIINEFVEDKTNGKIKNLLDRLDALTQMVIINAVYFKDNWKFQFDKRDTRPKKFAVDEDNTYTYDKTMHIRSQLRSANLPQLKARVLELPYEDESFRMLIVLPENPEDLYEVQQNLGQIDYKDLDRRLQLVLTRVQLPAFKVESRANLKSHLENLGVEAMFDASDADLSDISDAELYVSDVVHQANLEVNEEGSEAAAATAVVLATRAGGSPNREQSFIVNRPFFVIIQDTKYHINLFQGRIVDPEGRRSLRRFRDQKKRSSFTGDAVQFF